MTPKMIEFMFSDSIDMLPDCLHKVLGKNRNAMAHAYKPIEAYATMDWGKRWFHRSRLEHLGVKPYTFQNWYNNLTYWHRKLFGEFQLIETGDE